MIISKTPHRVSLLGGSTDLLDFIEKYKCGSVINFSINKYSYCLFNETLLLDETNFDSKFKNLPMIKLIYDHYKLPRFDCNFYSDFLNFGIGLSSSSSSIISLLHCINCYLKLHLNDHDICNMCYFFEKRINENVGFQDSYGCGICGIKRISFKDGSLEVTTLYTSIINGLYFYLYDTKKVRKSNDYLSDLSFDYRYDLLLQIDKYINSNYNSNVLLECINNSYSLKKKSGKKINENLEYIENYIVSKYNPKAFKLNGAGGGGYYLIINDKPIVDESLIELKIDVNGSSLVCI